MADESVNPTLLDQIKRTNPDGSVARLVEAMTQRNPVLKDATSMEGNLTTGHRVSIRNGLPTVGWRMLNQGIDASKSTSNQVDETCGLLEGRSQVDSELLRLNSNGPAFRASEDSGFLQALSNEAMSALFYGNVLVDPEKMHGWSVRYANLTGDDNSGHVMDLGGSGATQTSMWWITWGPDTAFLIYPQGTQAGIESKDMGEEYVEDADAKKFLAWRTHWIWRLGLCVKDWRYHVRIGNIDATYDPTANDDLLEAMIEAYNKIYDLGVGRTVIYCTRTVLTHIDKQVYNKSNMNFVPVEWHGRRIASFRGIPIVPCDGLAADEAELT